MLVLYLRKLNKPDNFLQIILFTNSCNGSAIQQNFSAMNSKESKLPSRRSDASYNETGANFISHKSSNFSGKVPVQASWRLTKLSIVGNSCPVGATQDLT